MNLSKTNPSICLNMIVKNESHIIIKTLNNLCSYINFSYWVICDTGSTDNTKELIKDFFKEKNINGELVEHVWKDFGYNRSEALKAAYNKTDYIFIFDADDEIVGNFKLPEVYDCDTYTLKFGKGFEYTRPLLFNNRKKWCYKGVLHEYLSNIDEVFGQKTINGDYYIISGRTGNRSKNPNKYIDDANILKKAYYDEFRNNYVLSCRYAFYCAQSYKDSGPKYVDDAIEWYKKCLELNIWLQEKFHSCFCIGELYMSKNEKDNALKYWYKTIEYDSERIDGIVTAVEFLMNSGQHLLVNALYHKFKNYNKKPQGKLFLFQNLYEDRLEYNNSISSYYVNDKESGYECCKRILLNKLLPLDLLNLTLSNLKFYIDILKTDKDTLDLFYSVDSIINDISNKNEIIDETIFSIWTILFEKNRKMLTMYSKFPFENKKSPNIILTFTTCKRFDLFKQTINSILNHWLDINNVDYWFCVDDNSSETDRNNMKLSYPWIEYYMKTIEEKGHRKSMNIIWNKLIELKPTYWIHMEDDFLFHNKMNYIEESINAINSELCKNNNVKQILFNRNYGETIEHYNIKGHILDSNYNNVALHKYINGNFNYQNCHYWPHYSFRPSLIDVKTILEIGNYDSENTFFEMDYAKKWHKLGYTSAFFNKITNRHIGRLTNDKNTKNVKNAYELNDENQFNKEDNIILHIEENNKVINISNNINFKIINLERRQDRKEETIKKLTHAGINKDQYEFINAVDGQKLESTQEIVNLFKENDFGNRRGVIGCALSHYNLWKQLLTDKDNEYYLIMEDDFTLCSNFKTKIESLKNEFISKDFIFLGYHMFENEREKVKNIYDNDLLESIKVTPLNQNLYIGGYFTYSINKNGAKILLNYIENNGIKHGIDYLNKIINSLKSYECQPHLVFSVWNEGGKKIDSDIQNIYDSLDIKITPINNSYFHRGRIGNLFFVNMALHFISEKNNLNVKYQFYNKFKKLGVELFIGEKTYDETIKLTDSNFFEIINGKSINQNILIVNDMWCQTSEFSHYLKEYFDEDKQKNRIINNNIYNERYNNNNDVFIHVRLGDIVERLELCQTFDYYDKILSNIKFNNGYISSDSINYYTCQKLIKKYNLQVIDEDEITTIMFGSTCKYLVLSSGTFSWLIGFLAYYSEVYYPKIIHKWHGDIFVFKSWNEIEYEPITNINDLLKNFIFIPKLDHYGDDIYYNNKPLKEKIIIAFDDKNCVGFNTLGFFKNNISIDDLKKSQYFGENDGIYIKKEYYHSLQNKKKHTIEKIYENDAKIMNDVFIETGAFTGDGIQAAINLGFKEIHSIELSEKYYNICKEKFKNYPYVHLHLGDSGIVLPNLIKNIKKGITFWLDGHYSSLDTACAKDYCSPILFELMSIKTYYHIDHVILIDDMKDFTQESIDWNNRVNKKCGYITKEKLEEIIEEIYSNCKLYYYGPACVSYNCNKNVNNNIRVKMICNWCSSEQLCKEWSNMCEEGFRWKNFELVWTNKREDIDYYVIINFPNENEYFDPSKTIVFQMEPWVYDINKNWGVKTWGKWAEPDTVNFLEVRGRKTEHCNLVQNNTELTLTDLNNPSNFEKINNSISSIMSNKYIDEGHILRIDFLKYLEKKGDLPIDIYGQSNDFNFINYKGKLPMEVKSKGYKSYKYYFMMENNFERNYITEKLWDPIFCECLCFYYGCPNVADYVDSRVFVILDINNFEKSYQIIKKAIDEDLWSQRIDIIRKEKQRILNEMTLFPTIEKIINKI